MTAQSLLAYAYWIALVPLAASLLILFFRKFLGLQGAWVGVLAMTYALVHASLIAGGIFTGAITLPGEGLQGHFFESFFTWFSVGSFDFRLGLLIDGVSSLVMVAVTLVSLMVQVYSIAYMHDHPRFGRYFAYINFFTFAMLILVMANELLQFFIGWELMGLCSYLLISFDFEKKEAAAAGVKAFLTTRIGDLGFYLALLVIFNFLGTFNIPLLHQNVTSVPRSYPEWVTLAVPLLLFCGAMGKSAQGPLYVWLPDAMQGPTPASALIHAATMVAAGVYMVARVFFFFEASPFAMDVVAWVGTATAVYAAVLGMVNSDIKRVLAFSTVSQLGLMMAALGCGGYEAGLFHLVTHAAFKSLLFLCAGSVIHGMHTNDMWKMGGLRTQMPVTAFAYFIGTLAITGCPGLSGFFSKDEILAAAYEHNPVIFGLLVLAALMTSFYMFRSLFLTFAGVPRDRDRFQHAHESPALILGPLLVLATMSAVTGFGLWYQGNLGHWVHWGAPAEEANGHNSIVFYASVSVFVVGAASAWWIYLSRPPKYAAFASLARKNFNVVDETLVGLFDRVGNGLSVLSSFFDGRFIDRVLVDGEGDIANWLGRGVRRLQSGLAQSYLFWMIVGLGAMLVYIANCFK